MLETHPQTREDSAMPKEEAPQQPQIEPRFLTLDAVAQYLSVSVPQVYSLVRSGDLPAIKIGGRGVWRVDRKKLDDYLDRLEKQTAEWAKAHPLNARDKTAPDDGLE